MRSANPVMWSEEQLPSNFVYYRGDAFWRQVGFRRHICTVLGECVRFGLSGVPLELSSGIVCPVKPGAERASVVCDSFAKVRTSAPLRELGPGAAPEQKNMRNLTPGVVIARSGLPPGRSLRPGRSGRECDVRCYTFTEIAAACLDRLRNDGFRVGFLSSIRIRLMLCDVLLSMTTLC